MGEVVLRFEELVSSLSWWKLHSRLVDLRKAYILSPVHYFFRRMVNIMKFRNPIPDPRQ